MSDTLLAARLGSSVRRGRERWRVRRKLPLIVVAEDRQDMRELLADLLEEEGYEVIEVEDGVGLLEVLGAQAVLGEPPDLVITDVRMPGLSGLDALVEVRESDPGVPFIVITAFGDPTTHARARRLGAVAVLDKPFPMETLLGWVRMVLPPDR